MKASYKKLTAAFLLVIFLLAASSCSAGYFVPMLNEELTALTTVQRPVTEPVPEDLPGGEDEDEGEENHDGEEEQYEEYGENENEENADVTGENTAAETIGTDTAGADVSSAAETTQDPAAASGEQTADASAQTQPPSP